MSTNYKADFPLLAQRDVAYLDSAATAQRPQCVLDAEREFYTRHNANPLRGLYPLSIEATEALESARAAVARFLGAAQSEELVFTRNTTEGLNLVAYSYGLSHVKAGDEILISTMEHHSNILPWQMVCRQTGAQLKFMECEPDGSLDPNKVEALITARTRVVALQQVSDANTPSARSRSWRTAWVRCWWWTARRARRTCRSTYRSWARTSSPSPATSFTGPWASGRCTGGASFWRRCRRFSRAAR